jgi:predicted Zn-dependent peptidase
MVNKFYKKVLKNGMTVLFEERKNSGVVSVAFAVRHGGIHETENEKGISHFIEHMLYKGTKNRTSKQISEDIEKNGGILNGFTEEELTAYWCKMPSKHIDTALEVLSDMILHPLFDETELNKERKVIFEEMKMRRDMPNMFVIDKIQTLLYSGNLGLDLIGTENSMNSITRESILKKFNKVYGSENLMLCVVGDTNFKKLCDFCEKNFKKSGFKITEPAVNLKNGERIEKRKGIDQINLIFAYHSPKASDKLSYASQVLSCLMTGGMSSRLFQEIREKRNLAYSVKGGYNGGRRFGYNTVFVGTSPGNLDKVKKLILEEFEKIKNIGEAEIDQVKEQLVGNSKISREDSQGQMLDLLYNEIWDDAKKSYQYESQIRKVNFKDVKKLGNFKNYSFIALVPETKEVTK